MRDTVFSFFGLHASIMACQVKGLRYAAGRIKLSMGGVYAGFYIVGFCKFVHDGVCRAGKAESAEDCMYH